MTDSVLLCFFCLFFLQSVSEELFLNAPLGTTLYSYDGLISHFLGQLCGHRALGGVRPLHVRHEQAHFLIGPPPLWVQLTVVPKRHLREGAVWGTGKGKQRVNTTNRKGVQYRVTSCWQAVSGKVHRWHYFLFYNVAGDKMITECILLKKTQIMKMNKLLNCCHDTPELCLKPC